MKYYVYVLWSKTDHKFYTGYTSNLLNRIKLHHAEKVNSTKRRVPLELIYWEGCLNKEDALRRESYLKSSWGKRYLKNLLKNYLTGWTSTPWWYYVTICTKYMHCWFGEIKNGKMILNDLGKVIDEEWNKTKEIRTNIELDYYVESGVWKTRNEKSGGDPSHAKRDQNDNAGSGWK